ncbi:DDE-type integrase/transposase/recombinase [Streptosporangium sp. NPDC087985]|uniref:DDE-type integrase/transposase/recombinase n=1 Tax=Streptosporangium sp. NPDC087985 TaxID=3366196 RepID=UPI0037FAACD0
MTTRPAHGPNDVWSWDITKLSVPTRGQFFNLYVVIDIFSRHMVHWEIHIRESGNSSPRSS